MMDVLQVAQYESDDSDGEIEEENHDVSGNRRPSKKMK